jgi:hypothetical protein
MPELWLTASLETSLASANLLARKKYSSSASGHLKLTILGSDTARPALVSAPAPAPQRHQRVMAATAALPLGYPHPTPAFAALPATTG